MTDKRKNPNRARIDARAAAKAAAIAKGDPIFHTGEPCPKGHLSGYYVVNGCCYRCSLDSARAWKAKNKARCREHGKKSTQKRRAAVKKYQAEWRLKNRERLLAEGAEYRKQNREKILKGQRRAYLQNKEYYVAQMARYRAENAQAIKERRRREKLADPEKFRSWDRAKHAKRRAAPGTHTSDDIAAIMKMQRSRCAYCRIKLGNRYHVDHITALSRGGSNDRRNLQILCQPCNSRKYALDPIDFAQRLGRLL